MRDIPKRGAIVAAASVLAFCFLDFPIAAQPASKGKFDGRWVGETIRCFPPGYSARPGAMVVHDGMFVHSSNGMDGANAKCIVEIGPDGTFSNKQCDVPTYGRIHQDIMELHFQSKADGQSCDVILKRAR